MGFHVCEYCKPESENRFSNMSSGDTTLTFSSGRTWMVPDMILHYVVDHGWLPPQEFIGDVMNSKLIGGHRDQTKSPDVQHIGYLSGNFEQGEVPEFFVEKLESLLNQAARSGNREQYRSA